MLKEVDIEGVYDDLLSILITSDCWEQLSPSTYEYIDRLPHIILTESSRMVMEDYCNGSEIKHTKLLLHCLSQDFIKYKDDKNSETHVGTYLLFPPAIFFKGGDLIIANSNHITSEFNKWTQLFIKLGTTYQISPITRNKTIIFKSEIHCHKKVIKPNILTEKDKPKKKCNP